MNTKDKIYLQIKNGKYNGQNSFTSAEIDEKCGINHRSYTSRVLSALVSEGLLKAVRSGRQVFYCLNTERTWFEENLDLNSRTEDEVWRDIKFPEGDFSENFCNIAYFAFTEMLNNAIDHSGSRIGYVKIWENDGRFLFNVSDKGIGIFRNIMNSLDLADEIEAIQELVKGKNTTAPKRHSGEGVFWTSKLADRIVISSYEYVLTVDNNFGDYTIEKLERGDERFIIGTKIEFEISFDTRKSLGALFGAYSVGTRKDYSFDTTFIPVKLFDRGDVWISRSQAKRLLSGLDKYQKIVLDFKGINLIGQGFADEIFRVFNIDHPEIQIESINTCPSVQLMIDRAVHDPTGRVELSE